MLDLKQNRRQFWPTLTTRHASLVPVSAEALQRERRQMQAKHLWYNLDIRWVDLKEKLEVLAPTGLSREDIWKHLFLTKQRKNPYEEGCYTGEDFEDVKRKWEAKKEYFLDYKKDGSHPPYIDLAMALHGFEIDNTAAYHAIENSLTELDKGYLMLHRGVQHMRASGSFGRFTLFHHLSHHPMTLAVGRSCWCFVFGLRFLLGLCLFPVLQASWDFTIPPRVLDLDDRQGFTARSALQ